MALTSKSLDRVRPDVPVNDVSREEQVRINLNVPESVRKRWKMAAIEAGRPLSDLIVEAMTQHLELMRNK